MTRGPLGVKAFSSTLRCDFWPLSVISDDSRVISDVFVKLSQAKKHCGINGIDHGRPCGTEFTLVSLYSTEISHYRSWFLEYKLTPVNSVAHGCPWWILYMQTSADWSSVCTHGPLTRYVKLRVAHAPGMPVTFSPPTTLKETAS